jgi:predicted adenylyl cyclase CyaB
MRNIELKARLRDPEAARRTALRVADSPTVLHLEQVDTYFHAPNGRLKLREEYGAHAEHKLVFYNRADESGPKQCDYDLLPVADPAAAKALLAAALGVRTVVKKNRTVYFHKNVRIHLDTVDGLGDFLEFEAVMGRGVPEEQGAPLVARLMREFGVSGLDLVTASYCDMMPQA